MVNIKKSLTKNLLFLILFISISTLIGCNDTTATDEQVTKVEQTKVIDQPEKATEEKQADNKKPTEQLNDSKEPPSPHGDLIVHFIDVGQGDATLLQGPDFTILIDAGRHDRNDVILYLKSVGVTSIDIAIGTHPHADHIGQLDKVIKEFSVSEVWMSGGLATSKTFERVLDAINDSDAGYHEPRAGESYQVGTLKIDVLHPSKLTGDLNDDSVAPECSTEILFLYLPVMLKQKVKERLSIEVMILKPTFYNLVIMDQELLPRQYF